MEILISIITSICVCTIFMDWYEKKLDIAIKTLMQEMKNISIEAIEEARMLSINKVISEWEKILKKQRSKNE